jgi:hypothetical protein
VREHEDGQKEMNALPTFETKIVDRTIRRVTLQELSFVPQECTQTIETGMIYLDIIGGQAVAPEKSQLKSISDPLVVSVPPSVVSQQCAL